MSTCLRRVGKSHPRSRTLANKGWPEVAGLQAKLLDYRTMDQSHRTRTVDREDRGAQVRSKETQFKF